VEDGSQAHNPRQPPGAKNLCALRHRRDKKAYNHLQRENRNSGRYPSAADSGGAQPLAVQKNPEEVI